MLLASPMLSVWALSPSYFMQAKVLLVSGLPFSHNHPHECKFIDFSHARPTNTTWLPVFMSTTAHTDGRWTQSDLLQNFGIESGVKIVKSPLGPQFLSTPDTLKGVDFSEISHPLTARAFTFSPVGLPTVETFRITSHYSK